MNKAEILKKYAREEEDKLLLAQVMDKLSAMERADTVTSTVFLNERQQALTEQLLSELRCTACGSAGMSKSSKVPSSLDLSEYLPPASMNTEG